jgi:hypothetical protein
VRLLLLPQQRLPGCQAAEPPFPRHQPAGAVPRSTALAPRAAHNPGRG